MASLHAGLQFLQLLAFLGTAAAALRIWWRHRSRPAAFLATAFGTLGLALLVLRLLPAAGTGDGVALVRNLARMGVVAFPWLLALFAWSFEPRIPRWLLAGGGAIAGLGVWLLAFAPLPPPGEPRTASAAAFLATMLLVWLVLAGAAGIRLWRAGGAQPLVRARMRLMAIGAVVLGTALVLASTTANGQDSLLGVSVTGLATASAVLFAAGFAPPRPLRMWWRRRVTGEWERMQTELIAAVTPHQAAQAVAPVVANLLGGGTAVVSADGELLGHARLDLDAATNAAERIRKGEPPAPGDELVALDAAYLVIRPTAYTPLFGQDERNLVAGFAAQLRLALERARLSKANEAARRDLQRASDDEKAMVMGLAHDLRGSSNTLGGYTSLLRSSQDDAEREEILAGIEASSAYLKGLVDSLLELSRAGAGPAETESVDLGGVVHEVAQRMSVSYPHVTVQLDPLPSIIANRLQMVQVFENLLTNAARHGGVDELTITVRHRPTASEFVIDVRDDGRGIDPDDREAIFTLFQRGRGAARGGSGIGLSLVRRILEAQRGRIELVESQEGAHFRLHLPRPTVSLRDAAAREQVDVAATV